MIKIVIHHNPFRKESPLKAELNKPREDRYIFKFSSISCQHAKHTSEDKYLEDVHSSCIVRQITAPSIEDNSASG